MLEVLIISILVVGAAAGATAVVRRVSAQKPKALPAPATTEVRAELLPAAASPGRSEGDSAVYDPKPSDIRPGDEVQFMLPEDLEPCFYSVVSATLTEVRDGSESWTEFAVEEMDGQRRFYLAYSETPDEGWGWSASAPVSAEEIASCQDLMGIDYNKRLPPPDAVEIADAKWRIGPKGAHVKARVREWSAGDKDETYKARLSDYREVGGDRELSIEIWKGGMSVTIDRGPATEVIVVKASE